MSVPVGLEKLRESITRFGSLAYLLTTGADGRPHAVSVHLALDQSGTLATRAGKRTTSNASERPSVCVLWSPVDSEGFSLIVDGTASVHDDQIVIRPETAVLHRQASAPGEASSSDCVGVLEHESTH